MYKNILTGEEEPETRPKDLWNVRRSHEKSFFFFNFVKLSRMEFSFSLADVIIIEQYPFLPMSFGSHLRPHQPPIELSKKKT